MASNEIRLEPDINNHQVAPETMVANTNKEISIPADATSLHIYNPLSYPVYFRLDKRWTAVPSAGTYVQGGFLPAGLESARILSHVAIGSDKKDHKLDLITAGAGDILVEFFS